MFYQQLISGEQKCFCRDRSGQTGSLSLSSDQLPEKLDFSEIKQHNEERLTEERKKQREAVERIKKQTETEVDFLQSRYNFNICLDRLLESIDVEAMDRSDLSLKIQTYRVSMKELVDRSRYLFLMLFSEYSTVNKVCGW